MENKSNLTLGKMMSMGANRQMKEQTKKEFEVASKEESQRRMVLREKQKLVKL